MKATAKFLALLLVCIVAIIAFGGCALQTSTLEIPPQWITPTFTVPEHFDWETNTKLVNNGRWSEVCILSSTPMEIFHSSIKWRSKNIAIAKYLGMTDVYNTNYVEHYFELIEPMKGYFGESTFTVVALQNKEYENAIFWNHEYLEVPYKKGENCVVFLEKSEDVFDGLTYFFASVFIPLDENNQIRDVHVWRGKVDIGCTTIDELKAYLRQHTTLDILDPSHTTSTKLEDTVHIAQNIYRVTVVEKTDIQYGKGSYSATVTEVLRGQPDNRDKTNFIWYQNGVQIGKEYVIFTDTERSIVSQAHGIIPVEDVKRMEQVYKILVLNR